MSYASRALDVVKQRYSQTEREALSVLYSCQKFHLYIYDMDIEIVTDHNAAFTVTVFHLLVYKSGYWSNKGIISNFHILKDIRMLMYFLDLL